MVPTYAQAQEAMAGIQGTLYSWQRRIAIGDDGSVVSVSFYRDSNLNGIFEPGTDQLLGVATDADGWQITFSTSTFGLGPQKYFAVATDDTSLTGATAATAGTLREFGILDNSQPGGEAATLSRHQQRDIHDGIRI